MTLKRRRGCYQIVMTPKWQKLASLAQEICTLWFQFFFGAVFASKGYPFKNILVIMMVTSNKKVAEVVKQNLMLLLYA